MAHAGDMPVRTKRWPARPWVSLAALAVVASAPAPAAAQPGAAPPAPAARPPNPSARHREGVYFSVGLGGGLATVRHLDEGGGQLGKNRTGLLAFVIGAGGTIGTTVLGGTALMIGTGDMEDAAGQTDHGMALIIGPSVDWYSSPAGGFHLGGMLGIGAGDVPFTDEGTEARAAGVGLWAGYVFWVGDEWSVGARLQLVGATATTTNLKTVLGVDDERSARFATWALVATATFQ